MHYLRSLISVMSVLAGAGAVSAEELKVEAKLIWGTNGNESDKPDHKPLDKKTAEMLKSIFTWKNYYLETLITKIVPSRGTARLNMSKDCMVEVTELPGSAVEIKLFGKGKLVNKTKESFNRDKSIVIGSDDKGECAWFVVLTRLN